MGNNFFKTIIMVLLIILVVSPADLMPGVPLDDLLYILMAYIINKSKAGPPLIE